MEVSETRLALAIISVFFLGMLLSVLNGYYIEDTGSSMPLLTYVVAAAAMGVGALIILLFQWRITTKQSMEMLKILPEDERKLMEVLLNDKKIEQTYLVAESGLNKVKVSRLLIRLEERGIIEKKPLGNTNLIILKI
jgi:predicted transcriptional regulator